MKRTLAILLTLAMVFALVACGQEPAASAPSATPAPVASTPTPTPEPTPEAKPEIPAPSAETAAALSKWADDLYEPNTTITAPATISWPATVDAVAVAQQEIRPNTIFVAIDENLAVSTLDGQPITNDLASYLADVKSTTLAALYISDDATADAFDKFATEYNVADVFVVADNEHSAYVKQICDNNVGILGIVDWRKADVSTERDSLITIIQQTNASHAKIALIPESIATTEAIEYLRGMLITVWVETSTDIKSVYTQITNGANGIFCVDYTAVANALNSVNDVTTLMRHVFITGHRGLPSQYIENTIRSERAAIEAGANVIECDISLSSDGVLFVLHDDDATRLFNRPDVTNVEDLTIAELQAMPYDMTDDTVENAPNSVLNANNTNRTTKGRENTVLTYDPDVDYIPTLREYLEALGDEDIIQFIEIKSYNPAIVGPFRELIEDMGLENRVCVITFNDGVGHLSDGSVNPDKDVMQSMFENWPEMSLGYLGAGKYYWGDLNAIRDEQGIGAAVGQLYSCLQPYNATCNDFNSMMFRDVIMSARHRGLTSWAWTYNDETMFAKDYLFGGTYSMTTNFSTWATNLPVQISVGDVSLTSGEPLSYEIIAQNGEVIADTTGISLVTLGGIPVSLDEAGNVVSEAIGDALVMLKLDTKLVLNGIDFTDFDNSYALYSNPFTITVK